MPYPDIVGQFADLSRHNGVVNFEALALQGYDGVASRCVIGLASTDATYAYNFEQSIDKGLKFIAYGVNWPVNRQPAGEARWFVDHLRVPRLGNRLPDAISGDLELGCTPDDYGHYKITGQELYNINMKYLETLGILSPVEVLLYSGPWYWNNPKLVQYITGREKRFGFWSAEYPFDDRARKLGLKPLIKEMSPWDLKADWHMTVAKPWDPEDIVGLQWTSHGDPLGATPQAKRIDKNVAFRLVVEQHPGIRVPYLDLPEASQDLVILEALKKIGLADEAGTVPESLLH